MKVNGRLAVDTNAVIAYREGIHKVCTLIEKADVLFLPVIVIGELLYGAFNSAQPQKNEQAVHKFSAHSVIVPIDETIAATGIELDVPLLSRDSHFNHIDGLKVINWEKSENILG